jgi:hypothetical protein
MARTCHLPAVRRAGGGAESSPRVEEFLDLCFFSNAGWLVWPARVLDRAR